MSSLGAGMQQALAGGHNTPRVEMSEAEMQQSQEFAMRLMKPVLFMFIVSQCLILASSISMLRFRGWNISVAGAIVAMIPCFSGYC